MCTNGTTRVCHEFFDCCDCGNTENGCGCGYCYSCNACEECLTQDNE